MLTQTHREGLTDQPDLKSIRHQWNYHPRNRHQTTQPNAAGDSNSNTALLNNMAGAENSSHTQVIWGTNINTNDVQNKLKNFIHNFELINEESDEENDEKYIKESHYISKLHEIRQVD